jgi:RES domain-containing protein
MDQLHRVMYFGLEPERERYRPDLIHALASQSFEPFEFSNWCRIVPYKYSTDPLSAAGSLNGIGGRFNCGREVESIRGFHPALYIADTYATAFRECYGLEQGENVEGLTPEELALSNDSGSKAFVKLHGRVMRLFDIRNDGALDQFCRILSKIKAPRELKDLSRKLKVRNKNMLIRTVPHLKYSLAANWRSWPVQFGLPSPSQVFAQLVLDAGYEGILYPSSKQRSGNCIALFPSEIASEKTFVEIEDEPPSSITTSRLDLDTSGICCGWEILRQNERRFAKYSRQR